MALTVHSAPPLQLILFFLSHILSAIFSLMSSLQAHRSSRVWTRCLAWSWVPACSPSRAVYCAYSSRWGLPSNGGTGTSAHLRTPAIHLHTPELHKQRVRCAGRGGWRLDWLPFRTPIYMYVVNRRSQWTTMHVLACRQHGGVLRWLIWVEDPDNEHIYHHEVRV